MENNALTVTNVSKTFKVEMIRGISNIFKKRNSKQSKRLVALDGISFTVQKGEILGLIGLNGSGKSTLIRIIAGIYKPDTGYIKKNGRLSPLMQLGAGFQGDLNAKDNIIMNGMLFGLPKSKIEEKVESIIQYAELEKFSNMKLKHYSSGMRSRLAFSTAMQIDSDILLIDEILAVGDKDFQKKSYETFLSLKKNNKTILHATHNLNKLSEICDKVLLLHKGKNVMMGKPEEVIKKYQELKPKN